MLFSDDDKQRVSRIMERLIGTKKLASTGSDLILHNLAARMNICGCKTLESYFSFSKEHPEEFPFLLSSLTIHTTYWFRENESLEYFYELASQKGFPKKIRVLSMGCSTGQEVYSLALILYQIHKENGLDFETSGVDTAAPSSD